MYSAILKPDSKPTDAGTLDKRMEDGSSLQLIASQCPSCLHLDRDNVGKCGAFPDGIPDSIMLGIFDHTFEYDMFGANDQGVTYSPLE
jgi:hypothetical protein